MGRLDCESLQELLQMLDERIRALEQLPDEEVRDQVFTIMQLIDRVPPSSKRTTACTVCCRWASKKVEHDSPKNSLTLESMPEVTALVLPVATANCMDTSTAKPANTITMEHPIERNA